MRRVGVVFIGVGAALSALNGFDMLAYHQAYGVWDPVFTALLETPGAASIGAGAWLVRRTGKSAN